MHEVFYFLWTQQFTFLPANEIEPCHLSHEEGDPMAVNEKAKIVELRQLGYGYKRIAKELSVSTSAVRYACRKSSDADLLTGSCENCGLTIKSTLGKKKKRFCSDQCRWSWWNKHQKEVHRKAYYTFRCKHCQKEFTAYGNRSRVFCSHECYIKFKLEKETNHHETL